MVVNISLLPCMQAWKSGTHNMGNVRPWEPAPDEIGDDVSLQDFTFKLIKVEMHNRKGKDFFEKYKVTLPAGIRARCLEQNLVQE